MDYQTIEVPFIKVGNRRALTLEQIMNKPEVAEFYKRYRHCFEEGHPNHWVFFLIEDKASEQTENRP